MRKRLLKWLVDKQGGATGVGHLFIFVVSLLSVAPLTLIYSASIRDIAGHDLAVRLAVNLRGHYSEAIPVTLIDIDDSTYRTWGEPALIPRLKLFGIIAKVAKERPLAIVVDIDLASSESQPWAEVQEFLQRYVQSEGSSKEVPLLLVRKLRADPKHAQGNSAYLTVRDGEVEAVVAKSQTIAWVSALLEPNEVGIFDRWSAFNPLCTDNPSRGIPSIALAAYVIHERGRQSLRDLDLDVGAASKRECIGEAGSSAERKAGLKLTSEPAMIPYFFGWPLPSTAALATTNTSAGRRPILMRLAAGDVEAAREIAAEALENRIVVIGASHADSQDIHRTPLGLMPGSHILANTIVGAKGVFGSSLSPWTRSMLYALPFFAVAALATVILHGLLLTITVTAVTVLAVVAGLASGVDASTIQGGVFISLVMLAAFCFLQQVYDLVRELATGPRRSIKASVLSEYGQRLLGVRK